MDNEYKILETISNNSSITQRELSKKTGLSLGSINLLLSKMVKEGLIKIKQIPMNRALYMLTPTGIKEKVNKTSDYIKIHYNYINSTKIRIGSALDRLVIEFENIYILLDEDEIGELVRHCATGIKGINIIIDEKEIVNSFPIIVVSTYSYEKIVELNDSNRTIINLLEVL